MKDHYSWSVNIGRWFGVPVRLHMCLVLFILLIFGVQWHVVNSGTPIHPGTALATSIALVVAILIHELAHVFATNNLGGAVKHLVLAPWGGDSNIELPMTRRSQAIVYIAGPFANLMVAVCGMVLLVQSGQAELGEIVNPLRPHGLDAKWEVAVAKIVTWVNFQLFWINMIPAHPFDASFLIRIAITAKNSFIDREKIETGVLIIGHAAGVIMLVCGWLVRDINVGPIQPTWLVLAAGGVTLLFSSRYGYYLYSRPNSDDEWDELVEELDDEFGDYYEDDNEYMPYGDADSISQWLQEKQEAREQIEREIEAEEERRVDVILKKVSKRGMESLDDEEKQLLQRVSDRYRRRNLQ